MKEGAEYRGNSEKGDRGNEKGDRGNEKGKGGEDKYINKGV